MFSVNVQLFGPCLDSSRDPKVQGVRQVHIAMSAIAVIWDALKAAVESDLETAKLIIDSAGIVVGPPDLTVCYDERGALADIALFQLLQHRAR